MHAGGRTAASRVLACASNSRASRRTAAHARNAPPPQRVRRACDPFESGPIASVSAPFDTERSRRVLQLFPCRITHPPGSDMLEVRGKPVLMAENDGKPLSGSAGLVRCSGVEIEPSASPQVKGKRSSCSIVGTTSGDSLPRFSVIFCHKKPHSAHWRAPSKKQAMHRETCPAAPCRAAGNASAAESEGARRVPNGEPVECFP